ncbi:PREDICTED: myosin-11-like [Priapulus caudatus]|uniref:Myosin-11-like n=1 Tax=Priapulus caudatus TaxID=37621 RepID=A0ABM1E5T7_PRICU|nr:PREDICTED: myosin-11-like [Priapulus caudatus]
MERDREHNSAVIMKDKCQIEESARMKVGEELEKIQLELSMYRHRLEASQESCSTLREERNSLAAEVHSLRQSLARQEARVSDVEQQYQQTLASTHNQSLYDVERLHKDRGSIEGEMKQLRRELEQTQGALRQAQAAVATHERTTERLQEQTLQSEALRTRAASLDTQNSQALGIIAELKAELAALTATNRHLQEKLEEVGIERKAVEARLDKQQLSTEVQLQHAEQKHHQQQRHLEEDKQEIVTRINKLLAQLHETEANLTTVTESKNHYLANQHMYEQELQSLKAQLQEEEAARRAGEERTAHVGRELELVRKQKVESHDKLCELQKHTSDLEAALQVEKNQVALLHEERATLRTSCTEQENYIRDLQQHIEQLQSPS